MLLFDEHRAKSIHNVKNRQGCEYVGGSWDKEKSICLLMDVATYDFEDGWTAPIHGAYFWYEVSDVDQDPRGPIGHVTGCLVKDSEDYPGSPGWCRAIYDKQFGPRKYVGDYVINHFEELVKDAMDLKLKRYGLVLINPSNEKVQGIPDQPFIGYPGIIEDFKAGRWQKKIPFKIRRR
jgi:hypothetical protein